MIREIEALPNDELQARAIAILKAKNRLPADDAKRVEDRGQDDPGRCTAGRCEAERSYSGLARFSTAKPKSASAVRARTPRPSGRPRKIKAATEQAAALPAIPEPINGNLAASLQVQNNAAPGRIDKSVLTISEPRWLRDKGHLKFVASQPRLICGRNLAEAHHLRFAQPRGMGLKVSDEFTVPLCQAHHRENHRFGDEQAWRSQQSIDPLAVSRQLWVSTRRL